MFRRHILVSLMLAIFGLSAGTGIGDETAPAPPQRQLFRGRVVRLGAALKRKGIPFSEEITDHLVLETPAGELIPVLADWRGKAFYQDERLRDRPVELVGIRRRDLPYLQVLMVYVIDEDGRRLFMDYWCEVCSIAMYEIKPCECCQGETKLRLREEELPEGLKQ